MNKTGKIPVHRAYILVTKHIKNQRGDKGDRSSRVFVRSLFTVCGWGTVIHSYFRKAHEDTALKVYFNPMQTNYL